MRKSRFAEPQIVAILKEHDVGVPTAENLLASMAFTPTRCGCGRQSTGAWMPPNSLDSSSSKMRTYECDASSRIRRSSSTR